MRNPELQTKGKGYPLGHQDLGDWRSAPDPLAAQQGFLVLGPLLSTQGVGVRGFGV